MEKQKEEGKITITRFAPHHFLLSPHTAYKSVKHKPSAYPYLHQPHPYTVAGKQARNNIEITLTRRVAPKDSSRPSRKSSQHSSDGKRGSFTFLIDTLFFRGLTKIF